MELHTAIRGILRMQGPDYITNEGFVNALDDFNAFEQNPALRNVLRIVVQDGYAKKLFQYNSWSIKAQGLVQDVIDQYAINPKICQYVFESLAVGLGFISESSLTGLNPDNQTPKRETTSKLIYLRRKEILNLPDEDQEQFVDDAEDYLNSIMSFRGDWEKDLGAKVNVSSKVYLYRSSIQISFTIEVIGRIKLKHEYHISFNIAVYGSNNKLIDTTLALRQKPNKDFEILETGRIEDDRFKTIGSIEKIVLYWDAL